MNDRNHPMLMSTAREALANAARNRYVTPFEKACVRYYKRQARTAAKSDPAVARIMKDALSAGRKVREAA